MFRQLYRYEPGRYIKPLFAGVLSVSLFAACGPPPRRPPPPDTAENGLLRVLDDKFPLIKSAHEGRTEEVKRLLKIAAFQKDVDGRQDKDGSTALIHSAEKGHVEIMSLLLQAGADPNLPDFKGRTPLIHTALRGKTGSAEKLLSAEDIETEAKDKYGNTAFTHAAKKGHTEIMDLLLKAGANPLHKNLKGRTPLMLAAQAGRIGAVKKLLKITDQINTRDTGRGLTALVQAIRRGRIEIIHLLLENGANPNLPDFKGRTPLMYSALAGRPPVVERLLQIESVRKNINSQDKYGNTAFLLAEEEGAAEIAALLQKTGADPRLGKSALLNIKKAFKKIFFRGEDTEEDPLRTTAGGGSKEKSFWEKTKKLFRLRYCIKISHSKTCFPPDRPKRAN